MLHDIYYFSLALSFWASDLRALKNKTLFCLLQVLSAIVWGPQGAKLQVRLVAEASKCGVKGCTMVVISHWRIRQSAPSVTLEETKESHVGTPYSLRRLKRQLHRWGCFCFPKAFLLASTQHWRDDSAFFIPQRQIFSHPGNTSCTWKSNKFHSSNVGKQLHGKQTLEQSDFSCVSSRSLMSGKDWSSQMRGD